MKKYIIHFSALLWILPLCVVKAQHIKPLDIGDKIPDLYLSNIYGHPDKKINPVDLKGKAIIIDFWATWCSPCVSSMKFLDSLQSRYENDLIVLCPTKEDNKIVKEVMQKLFGNQLPSFQPILQDSILERYFPHQSIPHCVWIDKNGIVKAITNKSEVTDKNIQEFIELNKTGVVNKVSQITYDGHKPPYASKQLELGDEFLYHSMFTKYRPDLRASLARGRDNTFISAINCSITMLYQCAFGKFNLSFLDANRTVCEGANTLADSVQIGIFKTKSVIRQYEKNLADNAYSYELATKDNLYTRDQLFAIMQEDLNRFFSTKGISGRVEKKTLPVIALIQINKENNYQSKLNVKPVHFSSSNFLKFENEPISFVISQLQTFLPDNSPMLVNQTGFNGKITIELNNISNDLISVNKALRKYGLELKEKEELTDVLVISKTSKDKN